MEKIIILFNKLNLKHYIFIFSSFFIPIAPLLFLVGLIIFADTFFGIMSSLKRGVRITSHRLAKGLLYKMFKYQMIILSIFVLDYFLLSQFVQIFFDKIPFIVTKLCAMALLFTEALSINENIKFVWDIDLFERLGNLIGRLFSIKKEFSKFED